MNYKISEGNLGLFIWFLSINSARMTLALTRANLSWLWAISGAMVWVWSLYISETWRECEARKESVLSQGYLPVISRVWNHWGVYLGLLDIPKRQDTLIFVELYCLTRHCNWNWSFSQSRKLYSLFWDLGSWDVVRSRHNFSGYLPLYLGSESMFDIFSSKEIYIGMYM